MYMLGQSLYSDECTIKAVAQITVRSHLLREGAKRYWIGTNPRCRWRPNLSKLQRQTDQEVVGYFALIHEKRGAPKSALLPCFNVARLAAPSADGTAIHMNEVGSRIAPNTATATCSRRFRNLMHRTRVQP